MESAVEGNRQRVVLVVEDSETSAAMLEISISSLLGVTVVLAGSAAEALRVLWGGMPVQAIVTDLNMPGMDGFDLIRAVRADPRFSDTPVLVISGDTDSSTPARAAQIGANAFFSKPYSPVLLRRTLEQLLNATTH